VSETTFLYRPVGEKELQLIRESGFRRFPPRLPEQPFFYPVLTQVYAEEIARQWNAPDPASGQTGCVLRFQVKKELLRKYEVKQVGDVQHREYWIPAEDLDEFNDNIVGVIEILAEYRGS